MTGAYVIRWGASIPGREAKALEVFGKAIEYFETHAKQGRIHGHREYIAVTGAAGGFMVAEGELSELMKIATENETLELNSQAEAIVSDFEVQFYAGGSDQTVQETVGIYAGALNKLGYM